MKSKRAFYFLINFLLIKSAFENITWRNKARWLLDIKKENVMSTVQEAWNDFVKNDIIKDLTLTINPQTQKATINKNADLFLEIEYEPVDRNIIFSNIKIPFMKDCHFYAKQQISSSVQTLNEIKEIATKKFTSFANQVTNFLEFENKYSDINTLTDKIKAIIISNSGGAFESDDLILGFPNGVKRKDGHNFQVLHFKNKLFDNFFDVYIDSYRTRASILIEMTMYKIISYITPQMGREFDAFEASVKQLFTSQKISELFTMDDIQNVINENIGECAEFQRQENPESGNSLVYNFKYVKKEEAVVLDEFRERRLRSLDCDIHMGSFIAYPLNSDNFEYIHLVYMLDKGQQYSNENLLVLDTKDKIKTKIGFFVQEIIGELKFLLDPTEDEVIKREEVLKAISSINQLNCDVQPADLSKTPMICYIQRKERKVPLIEISIVFKEIGNDKKSNLLISTFNIKNFNEYEPIQSYVLDESQTKHSFRVVENRLKEYIERATK